MEQTCARVSDPTSGWSGPSGRVGKSWPDGFQTIPDFFFFDPTRLTRLTIVGSDSNPIQHLETVKELLAFDTHTCTQIHNPTSGWSGQLGRCLVGKSWPDGFQIRSFFLFWPDPTDLTQWRRVRFALGFPTRRQVGRVCLVGLTTRLFCRLYQVFLLSPDPTGQTYCRWVRFQPDQIYTHTCTRVQSPASGWSCQLGRVLLANLNPTIFRLDHFFFSDLTWSDPNGLTQWRWVLFQWLTTQTCFRIYDPTSGRVRIFDPTTFRLDKSFPFWPEPTHETQGRRVRFQPDQHYNY